MGLIGRVVDLTHESCTGVDSVPLGIEALAGTQRMQADLPVDTQKLWRAVAAAWPKLTGLGAWGDRSHQSRVSCHNYNTGRPGVRGPKAVDCMTRDLAYGAKVAAWAVAHRTELGITLVIHNRKKWSAATKWKAAPYRGTSPHTDHVHLSVNC